MWEARAEYEDGTRVEKVFESNALSYQQEEVERHQIESWLVGHRRGCVWYTVNWAGIHSYDEEVCYEY